MVKILGNDDLSGISTWADELKLAERGQGPLSGNPEAVAVNAKFPKNAEWHFADLPLGTTAYRDDGNDRFANNDDIVYAINRCVGVLEAPPGQKSDLTKAEALKFLVHLIGDIHQPLHCGCGYYDVHGHGVVLITDPDKAYRHPTDKGGNDLGYGKSHFQELHASWIPANIAGKCDLRVKSTIGGSLLRPQGAVQMPTSDFKISKPPDVWILNKGGNTDNSDASTKNP